MLAGTVRTNTTGWVYQAAPPAREFQIDEMKLCDAVKGNAILSAVSISLAQPNTASHWSDIPVVRYPRSLPYIIHLNQPATITLR